MCRAVVWGLKTSARTMIAAHSRVGTAIETGNGAEVWGRKRMTPKRRGRRIIADTIATSASRTSTAAIQSGNPCVRVARIIIEVIETDLSHDVRGIFIPCTAWCGVKSAIFTNAPMAEATKRAASLKPTSKAGMIMKKTEETIAAMAAR